MSVVLSEHLPLLASAPDGIQKLRGLILELAVRGKLVSQDPDDEPASELLKRITKERARREAKGTCKKSKPVPPVGEDEHPFDAPNGWEWVRLATIGNILNGNSINSDEKEAKFRRKDGLPYIATKDVGYGLTPLDYENGVRIPESEPNFRMAHEGAVFICAEGGSAGKKCGITDRNVFFGNKLFANEAFAGIPPRVILYLYLSPFFREQFVAAMTGIIGGVSFAKFVEIPIPLPPLAEQHRIVVKADELMALCDRLEQEVGAGETAHSTLVETLLGTLTQSTDADDLAANWQRLSEHFNTLFTTEASIDALKQTVLQLAVMGKLVPQDPNDEPVLNRRAKIQLGQNLPANWGIQPLSEIATEIVDCPHSTPKWTNVGMVCVRTSQFKPGFLDLSNPRYVSEATYLERIQRLQPKECDILYSREGGILGVACRVPPNSKLCLGQRMMLIRSGSRCDSKFLEYLLNSPLITTIAREMTLGGAAPRVNVATVKAYPIPLPPLAEQHRIVAKVDELIALCDRLKADLAESRTRQARLATTLIESALKAA